MQHQAEAISEIVREMKPRNLAIIAHSMGGPIAVSLIEKLAQETEIEVTHLLYLEGNIDIGDAFFSSKVASREHEEYMEKFESWYSRVVNQTDNQLLLDAYRGIYDAGPTSIWASSMDLVRVSKSGEIIDKLKKMRGVEKHFFFGDESKGVYSSERLVIDLGYQVYYVPEAGHMMHLENPDWFWKKIRVLLS
jgi:pimeloyl-ACP methyl ester carboxylesterase